MTRNFSLSHRMSRPTMVSVGAMALLVGCSMVPLLPDRSGPTIETLVVPHHKPNAVDQTEGIKTRTAATQTTTVTANSKPDEGLTTAQQPRFWETPNPQPIVRDNLRPGARAVPAPTASEEKIEAAVNLDNLPIPVFINTIYATILKRNVSLDSAIQSRTDLVSLRTGASITGLSLAQAAATVLRSYGVVVLEYDGIVRVVPESSPSTGAIELLRSRSQPDVPNRIRPVFHFYEMVQTNSAQASQWLQTLFPNKITVTENGPRNAVMLSGQSDAVAAAIEALEILDQPYLRGRFSKRITPAFWSAQEMATRLTEVLTAQGIYVGTSPNLTAPLLLIPVPQINSIMVFGSSQEMVDHALRWAQELDLAPPARRNGRYITYNVRNTDAQQLATTLQQLLGGPTTASTGPASSAVTTNAAGSSRVVVNKAANSLILQANPDDYAQMRDLLVELDRPTRSALIMVTVAEVSLSDTEQLGFNWLLKQFSLSGYKINGNIGGTGTAPGSGAGINLGSTSANGDPRAVLAALATSNRVKVLSNPSIIAINGEAATIQVGQDVPVLTSQISSAGSTTATSSLVQSVQYRNVGIILNVTPVIHSGGRLQLKISQEVSGVASGSAGVGSSPIFTTRRVDTSLNTVDGQTMLIGGLIREQRDGGNSGVPLAKDVPILGSLFRSAANDTFARTELVILITPYVIEDDVDAQAVTNAFRNQFAWAKQINPDLNTKAGDAGPVTKTLVIAPGQISQVEGSSLNKPSALSPAPSSPLNISMTSSTSTSSSEKSPLTDGRKPYVLKPQPEQGPNGRPSFVPPPAQMIPPPGARTPSNPVTIPPSIPRATTTAPTPAAPAGSERVVTDPALLRELQDAIRQSGTLPGARK